MTTQSPIGARIYLMACPFCGQTPEAQDWHGGGPLKTRIDCVGIGYPDADVKPCEVSPSVTGETPSEAANHWNRRAASLNMTEMVEVRGDFCA
jgi:hypothetical protein